MSASDVTPAEHSLVVTAQRVGALLWFERRLFEVLGAASARADDLEAMLVLAEHARHHAWRAEQLFARLPELRGLPAEDLVRPPAPQAVTALDALAAETSTADLVATTYLVLVPLLREEYLAVEETLLTVADRSLARTVWMAVADLTRDEAAGVSIATRLGVDPGTVDRMGRLLVGDLP